MSFPGQVLYFIKLLYSERSAVKANRRFGCGRRLRRTTNAQILARRERIFVTAKTQFHGAHRGNRDAEEHRRTRILLEPQGRRVDYTSFCCRLCLSLPGQTRRLNRSHRMDRPQPGAPARGGSGKDHPAPRGALREQQKFVQSTRVFPCPKSLCFLGALCASAVCFFFGCGCAAPRNSWRCFLFKLSVYALRFYLAAVAGCAVKFQEAPSLRAMRS